jgi:hypothetical protein
VANGIQGMEISKVGCRFCSKILQQQDQACAMVYASLESHHVAVHGWRCGEGVRSGKMMEVPKFNDEGGYGEI